MTSADAPAGPWPMWAQPNRHYPGTWLGIDTHPIHARSLDPGKPPTPVTATVDEHGMYRGWLPTGADAPILIQHHRLFDMQFPYGAKAEVDAGKGTVIHLTVLAADQDTAPADPAPRPASYRPEPY